jgi:archaellum component FlaF (FlaF/FlaG flagellin family)
LVAGEYSVIKQGEILLIRNSECERPNIATHELLHVLGFNHSNNPMNIMYPITECNQEVSQDIYDSINKLYSQNSYPDLMIENVSATINGKYLDINISMRNNGLADADTSKLKIYADGKLIKEIDSQALQIGHGVILKMTNLWIGQISINELEIVLESYQQELNKDNNEIKINLK